MKPPFLQLPSSQNILRDRIAGALAGVMIGDAMGMPVESWKHAKIMTLNGGRGVIDFMPSQETNFRSYDAGETTDDWQLTRAVTRSLIRTGGHLDLADVAAEHVKEWSPDRSTWGRSTHKAIRAIKAGERDPLVPLPLRANSEAGSGSGVLMKVAGLAAVHALRQTTPKALAADCLALGRLTHVDPIASVAAYAVAEAIRMRIVGAPIDIYDIAEVCNRMTTDELFSIMLLETPFWDAEQRRGMPFRPFSALYCGLFSIATAQAHKNAFSAGVLEAVNAGGDADSNASVVGAIIGAGIGWSALPEQWKSFNPTFSEALELANALIDSVRAQKKTD